MKTQIILKIVHACNFACKYCNYAKTMAAKPGVMPLELVEEVLKQCSASKSQEVCLIWHGGEPLMVGLEYFRQIVAWQKKYLGSQRYINCIQTNGSMLSEALVDFFQENHFQLSISLDGPPSIHDANRVDPTGRGTHEPIMAKLHLLQQQGISFALMAVYSELMHNPQACYAFFKSIKGLSTLDILAMNKAVRFQKNFGRFLTELFDLWWNDREGALEIRILNSMFRSLLGLGSTMCHFSEQCVLSAHVIAIDPQGDVYPCDRELFNSFLLGNIRQDKIDDLLARHAVRNKFAMLQKKQNESCQFCEWYGHCGGGCPSDYDSLTKRNAYCADYQLIFQHIATVLQAMGLRDATGKINLDQVDRIPNASLAQRIKHAYSKCQSEAINHQFY